MLMCVNIATDFVNHNLEYLKGKTLPLIYWEKDKETVSGIKVTVDVSGEDNGDKPKVDTFCSSFLTEQSKDQVEYYSRHSYPYKLKHIDGELFTITKVAYATEWIGNHYVVTEQHAPSEQSISQFIDPKTGKVFTKEGATAYHDGFNRSFIEMIEEAEKFSREVVDTGSKYHRTVCNQQGESISGVDVYDVLTAFKIENAALQHALKKMLCAGTRGHKNFDKDIDEAIVSLQRAKQIQNQLTPF